MFRQNGTRVLVEKIDDAIEQAEDLGLAFVAGLADCCAACLRRPIHRMRVAHRRQ